MASQDPPLERGHPVSVVIPFSETYTPESALDEAIESAESQSVPTDVIVVEDEDDRGPAWARNRGLERAETRLVAFLDADDRWKAGKLERQLRALADTGAGVCLEGPELDTDTFIERLLLTGMDSLTPSVLVDMDRVDVRFDESLPRFEDQLFVIEAAAAAGVCFCPDLVEIRKHDGGLSAAGSPELRCRAKLQMADKLAERVPAARPYLDTFRRHTHYAEGRRLQQAGDYGAAIPHLRKALSAELHYKPGAVLLFCYFARLSPTA